MNQAKEIEVVGVVLAEAKERKRWRMGEPMIIMKRE